MYRIHTFNTPPKVCGLFLDANIFFAAARSPSGGSGLIFELAKKKKITILTINFALIEAERNIKAKAQNDDLARYYENLAKSGVQVQSIGDFAKKDFLSSTFDDVLPLKDMPIFIFK